MDIHEIGDAFRRFGSSPAYVALLITASLVTTVSAGWRTIANWWRTRQREKAISYLAVFVDRTPELSSKLATEDDPQARQEATEMIASAIQQTEAHIRLTAGKAMRRNADLPGTGKITSAQTESPLAGYESMPPTWHVQQRTERLAAFIRILMDEGTI